MVRVTCGSDRISLREWSDPLWRWLDLPVGDRLLWGDPILLWVATLRFPVG